MRSSKTIHVISAHAEGEVGDVIVGGVAPPPGATLWEQRRWIAEDQTLRNFVLNEPRGGVFRHVNLLVPPKHPEADAAFIAFCVMVGLQWSVKSKGAIASAVATIGIVGAIAGVLGLCGAAAGPSVPFLGPMLTTLNPATAVFAMCDPAGGAAETLSGVNGLSSVAIALLTGAGASAIVYSAIVWAMLTSMVRSFDMTVRRLAGTK